MRIIQSCRTERYFSTSYLFPLPTSSRRGPFEPRTRISQMYQVKHLTHQSTSLSPARSRTPTRPSAPPHSPAGPYRQVRGYSAHIAPRSRRTWSDCARGDRGGESQSRRGRCIGAWWVGLWSGGILRLMSVGANGRSDPLHFGKQSQKELRGMWQRDEMIAKHARQASFRP